MYAARGETRGSPKEFSRREMETPHGTVRVQFSIENRAARVASSRLRSSRTPPTAEFHQQLLQQSSAVLRRQLTTRLPQRSGSKSPRYRPHRSDQESSYRHTMGALGRPRVRTPSPRLQRPRPECSRVFSCAFISQASTPPLGEMYGEWWRNLPAMTPLEMPQGNGGAFRPPDPAPAIGGHFPRLPLKG
jgi:hypothetical protein